MHSVINCFIVDAFVDDVLVMFGGCSSEQANCKNSRVAPQPEVYMCWTEPLYEEMHLSEMPLSCILEIHCIHLSKPKDPQTMFAAP